MTIRIMKTTDFDKGLAELERNGGNYKRAIDQVLMLLGKAKTGTDPFEGLKLTKYGETRISKCWKYDLSKFCRLVTIRDKSYRFLCFVGKHKDCDKWLDKNRGLSVKVGTDMEPVKTFKSINLNNAESRVGETSNTLNTFHGRSLNDLPEKLLNKLLTGVDSNLTRNLKEMVYFTDDEEIVELVSKVPDNNQSTAIYDAIMHIRAGELRQAENTANVFSGDLESITEFSNLNDSEDFHKFPFDSEQYRKLIEHYSKTADYKDWMLFMHPDQEKFVNAKYSGSSKISGVSGSGKTCVIVKRAIHLAEIYPKEKILVLTLNRSLATLIRKLVDTAATDSLLRDRIKVLPLFSLCRDLLNQFDRKNWKLYDDITWKSQEHIDEVWIEYYRCELNNHDARVMQQVHDSLIARGIDAESYIREEFDWIRSATPPEERSDYLTLQRTGRSYPMDKIFRQALLDGLELWEEKMRQIGVSDYLGLSTVLYRYIEKIRPTYRSILVDESQDFGTIELKIIRKLAKHQENDLFFCGDAAQQVSSKHQSFKMAGIDIPSGRSKKLLRNYRNSIEILNVAYAVLVDNLSEEIIDNKEFEVLDPNFGFFHGPDPLLLSGDSLAQEIDAAKRYIEQELEHDSNQKACLVFCGHTLHELEKFGKELRLPVLDGTIGIDDKSIFVSDLENSKGFEFQHVCILNCSATVIPYPESPEDEQFRDLARLYVAMTRARTQLILSYTGEPSSFLQSAIKHFLEYSWLDYLNVEPSDLESRLVPQKLNEIREYKKIPFSEMTGEQFLYTDEAIGLDLSLIEKIRELICGKRHTENGRRVKWKNFSDAATDMKTSPHARKQLGKDYKQFKALLISKGLM